jgi:hypothetical protein
MSSPAAIAWYRNAACIASRISGLPRKENDTLLTPPLVRAYGHSALMRRTASMNSMA